MNGKHTLSVGDRGRLVIPAAVRERRGLAEGSVLVLVDADEGMVLLTRAQLHARIVAGLAGHDLVADLIADRRDEARRENAEHSGRAGDAAA